MEDYVTNNERVYMALLTTVQEYINANTNKILFEGVEHKPYDIIIDNHNTARHIDNIIDKLYAVLRENIVIGE